MCFLPPQCVFCVHSLLDNDDVEADCLAFEEIPDSIFLGDLDHSSPVEGDQGVVFLLREDLAEDFREVNELRLEMGLKPLSSGVSR